MAIVVQYWAKQTFLDSAKKSSTVETRWGSVAGDAWINAADATARNATAIGTFFLACAALVAAPNNEVAVEKRVINDAITYAAPDDNVYHFDKIALSLKSGLDIYTLTLPSRDDATYLVADDGVTIITTGDGASDEMVDLKSAIDGNLVVKNGGTATLVGARVAS